MPAYDYVCQDCKTEFTVISSILEYIRNENNVVCSSCYSKNVKRTITNVPVIKYMGKGFYSTDNKSKTL